MGEEEFSWKSHPYRQRVIEQIKEARAESTSSPAVTKSSEELEEHVFNKANSKDEYILLIARLILFLRNRSTGEPPVPGFQAPFKNGSGHRAGNGSHWGPYAGNVHHLPPYQHPHGRPSSSYVPKRQQHKMHMYNNEEEELQKCHKFLSMCLQLTVCLTEPKKQTNLILVQSLIDGKLSVPDFVTELLTELKAPKQPYLVTFIEKNLERLRQALISGEMWIAGIRPPGMEGPVMGPLTATHMPADLGMDRDRGVLQQNFIQPNMPPMNNHHHQARPHHPPPPPPQMHISTSQGSLCADLLTSTFTESGGVMQDLFDFMGTGPPDTFTDLTPMRHNQDMDNYIWGNNGLGNNGLGNNGLDNNGLGNNGLGNNGLGNNGLGNNGMNGGNMNNTNNMGYIQPVPVHSGSNGMNMNLQPALATSSMMPHGYSYQNGMRMQPPVEHMLSPQPVPQPQPPVMPPHSQAHINNGRSHIMHHMLLQNYIDDTTKLQGFEDLDKHSHNGGNGI